jgi:putative transcriptional regulator
MTAREMEGVSSVKTVLKKAGFTVSPVYSKPSCFNLAARKDDSLILIKVQPDIGGISPHDSLELRVICENILAASLIVGNKTREKPLEDDTVYFRYNVPAVTPRTFKNIILKKIYPLVQAGPGGYYVEIDGEALRQRRQKLSLSAGMIAEKIGVSRRTLYGYEKGMTRTSVTIAYKLLCTLGVPIAKSVDIFNMPNRKGRTSIKKAKRLITKSKIFQRIFKNISGYDIIPVRKTPFDFLITNQEDNIKIIGSVTNGREDSLSQRVSEILSLSKVVQAHAILVTENKKAENVDIPCISRDKISKIRDPEELCKI